MSDELRRAACAGVLTQVNRVFRTAGVPPDNDSRRQFLHSLPRSREELADPAWQGGACYRLLKRAYEADPDSRLTDYFMDFWPKLPSDVRAWVVLILDGELNGMEV